MTGAVTTVAEAYAAWHDHVLARLERTLGAEAEELIAAAAPIVERLSAAGDQLVTAVIARLNEAGGSAPDEEERELLDALRTSAEERAEDCPRIARCDGARRAPRLRGRTGGDRHRDRVDCPSMSSLVWSTRTCGLPFMSSTARRTAPSERSARQRPARCW